MASAVAGEIGSSWPKENIPDGDTLYRWVHREHITASGTIRPGAFRDYQGGMSADWGKYSTPEETRQRPDHHPKEDFAVVELHVRGVRNIGQEVDHDPLPHNQAHTNVIGEKDAETRVKLVRLSKIVLPLEDAG